MPHTILKEFSFAAAHHIPEHPGKCRNLHGHNYRVRLFLRAEELDRLGMVIDFAEVKRFLKEVAGPFDHRVINDFPPFDERPPTAELVSEYVFREVEKRLAENGAGERVDVARVEVWENDVSCAIYER